MSGPTNVQRFLSPTAGRGFPTNTVPCQGLPNCRATAGAFVGDGRHGDYALERLIRCLDLCLDAAYARFQVSHSWGDRADAVELLRMLTAALGQRNNNFTALREQVAADEGFDYFQAEGARLRRLMIAEALST